LIFILRESDIESRFQLHRGLDHGKGVRAKLVERCERRDLFSGHFELLGDDRDSFVGHIFLEDVQAIWLAKAPKGERAARTGVDSRGRGLRIEWDIRIAMKTAVWVDCWR
jgi:hypothetical protein